ncbi:hypothetical protein [Clostridium tertium]|uniref:Uncharacterized protein n=1 Tax=Clostridium tertium TaxID=1559 RepID=A0A6N3GYW7_9CLOT
MESKLRTKRLNVSWVIIAGIIGAIAGIAGIIATIYGVNAKESTRFDTSYAVNQSIAITETRTHWRAGSLYYGVNQTAGTVGTKYSIYWKKNSGNYILEWSNGYCKSNNAYYGEWYMHYTTGIDKYAYKLVKETNKNKASKLVVDLMLL